MSKITKNKVRVGDTNGYEVAYDSAADQLNIKDLENSNTITIDVGQEILADKLDAANQIALPVYSDNSNAPTEDGSIWFNDGSGGDTAGIYIYDGTVTGPYNTGSGSSPGNLSGLTIDTDKGWSGYVITGVGHDSVRVPVSRDLTVADFEEGVLDTDVWSGDTGSASIQSSTVESGSYALKIDTSGGNVGIISHSGLNSYFQQGDVIEGYIYLAGTDDVHEFFFGLQSTNIFPDDTYRLQLNASSDEVNLYRRAGGSNTLIADDPSADFSSNLDEWLKITVEWGLDGSINITIDNSAGNEITSISATDTKYKQGGIGFLVTDALGNTTKGYFDSWTITRRENEARYNTKKGVTELGNEATPSGATHTGPQEAPLNALRQVYADAPVDDGATQGDVSLLTLLQSGLNPAIYLERILDGQGGAYAHRLHAALGEVGRRTVQLDWGYESLADVPNWTAQTSAGFTGSLTSDTDRRIRIEHDGSASSRVYGGLKSFVITDQDAIGGFAITFKNMTFTDNGSNRAMLGVSTYRSLGTSRLDKQGTGVVFRPDTGTFYKVESGTQASLATVTVNNGGDVTIAFRNGEVAGYHNGGWTGWFSFTEASAAMYPAIQLEDDDSVSDALEVDDIIVEPLAEVLQ